MPVKINGATSGGVTLDVPAVAGTNTVTIAAQTGTLNAAGPAFHAAVSGNQTVTAGVETKVQLNNEVFDTNGCFDPTTNYRFTPNVAGYYQINWAVSGNATTTFTKVYSVLVKNGTSFYYAGETNATLTANTNNTVTGSLVIYMNGTTDYLELFGFVGGTGTATFRAQSMMSGFLARGA